MSSAQKSGQSLVGTRRSHQIKFNHLLEMGGRGSAVEPNVQFKDHKTSDCVFIPDERRYEARRYATYPG